VSAGRFDRIQWSSTDVRVGDVVFDLASADDGRPDDLMASRPRLIKDELLVADYERVFTPAVIAERPRMFELGLWDGASAIFWSELLDPAVYIGIDLDDRGDSEVLKRYATEHEQIVTRWGVSQTDREALCALVHQHNATPLDLVVDDASHLYEPTKASFEILFPLLRPGGLYLIEDWAWSHWQEYGSPEHPWAFKTPPTQLVCELVAVAGGSRDVIQDLTVLAGLVAVTRGPAHLDESFSLDGVVTHRSAPSTADRLRHFGRRAKRKVLKPTR
jgi:Methyltransferase domain